MGKRNYMLLLSLTKANAESGKRVLANLQSRVDANAKPLWLDSGHGGFVFASESPACDVWRTLFINPADSESFNDVLIVEIGPDWMARPETKHGNWLAIHAGHPRSSLVWK